MLAAPLLALVALAPAAPEPWGAEAELERRLAELSSPEGATRALAERWLGAHLAAEDYALLVDVASTGDAEVAGRIARALGSDGRHLGLAVRLMGEPVPRLRSVGEEALRRIALGWGPELERSARIDSHLSRWLETRGRRSIPHALEVDLALGLDELVERVNRSPAFPLGVALEPGVHPRGAAGAERGGRRLRGTWHELLLGLALEGGLVLEGHGMSDRARDPALAAFLRLVPAAAANRENGVDILRRWCELVARDPDPGRRAAAARALAASGWPAALGWMEARWQAAGDPASLEGLLAAAGAGRVAPALARPDAVRSLVARAASELERGDPASLSSAHRVLAALAETGCVGPAGEELVPLLFEGEGAASPRRLWLTLVLVERWGCSGEAGAVARAPVRAVLEASAGAHAAELRVRALRAWAVLARDADVPAPLLGDPLGMLRDLDGVEASGERALDLTRAGVRPPEAWRSPEPLAGEPLSARLAATGWWLGLGDREAAAAHAGALLASGDPADEEALAALLRRWVRAGLPEEPSALLLRTREIVSEARQGRIDRVALLTGVPPRGSDQLLITQARADSDLALLGALAGRVEGVGADARAALLALLRTHLAAAPAEDPPPALRAALETALESLFSSGRDDEARLLAAEVRDRLSPANRSPWAREVLERRWPPAPRSEPRQVGAEEPRWN